MKDYTDKHNRSSKKEVDEIMTKKEVSTLVVLHSCSQGMFMKESIQKKFSVTGSKTEITMKMFDGKQKNMESTLVSGLKVSKIVYGEGVRWLNFLATYTRKNLAADVEEVVTQEKART